MFLDRAFLGNICGAVSTCLNTSLHMFKLGKYESTRDILLIGDLMKKLFGLTKF